MELLAYVCVCVYIYIYLISATPYITCWEIVSNSNCGLKSQLGFVVEEGKNNLGFFIVEGKTIPWCGRKSIPC